MLQGENAALRYQHLYLVWILTVLNGIGWMDSWRKTKKGEVFTNSLTNSGAPLIRRPFGPFQVSCFVRCPDPGSYYTGLQQLSSLLRCPYFRGSWFEGFHHSPSTYAISNGQAKTTTLLVYRPEISCDSCQNSLVPRFRVKPGNEPRFRVKPGNEPRFRVKPGNEPRFRVKPGNEPRLE